MPVCGPWFGGWFVFPLVGLVLMVVVLLMVFSGRGPFAHFGGRSGWGAPPASSGPVGSALDILKVRYARGELTREQFEQMRRDVE
jgi:putative membrane protein